MLGAVRRIAARAERVRWTRHTRTPARTLIPVNTDALPLAGATHRRAAVPEALVRLVTAGAP
eukprot:2727057-Rhodomonas_salina.1